MEHMNVKIQLQEFFPRDFVSLEPFKAADGTEFYLSSDEPVYLASSAYGMSFAKNTEDALQGAKEQVERGLAKR